MTARGGVTHVTTANTITRNAINAAFTRVDRSAVGTENILSFSHAE